MKTFQMSQKNKREKPKPEQQFVQGQKSFNQMVDDLKKQKPITQKAGGAK